ncbi:hypothetical protein MferCBS31731_005211 [Microsporum ferrugineum]
MRPRLTGSSTSSLASVSQCKVVKVTLARLTYEHPQSQKALYQYFVFLDTKEYPYGPPDFQKGAARFASFGSQSATTEKAEAERLVNLFAEYPFSNSFLPLKSRGNRTPQPIPAALSGPLENVAGPSARLPYLRNDCLIRSHHRCVATRECEEKYYAILRMFDLSVISLIEGPDIDPSTLKLLAIYRAICIILQFSGAGEYIDRTIRGMEEVSDGSTELSHIASLELGVGLIE